MQLSSLAERLKKGIDKWRLFFLIFLIIYGIVLVTNLGEMTVQWDEANHLNGGFLLLKGRTQEYVELAMFYPPLDDVIIAGFFSLGGVSVFNGRLPTFIFALLSVWAIFEFTSSMYGKKIALLSSVFLSTMPGFIWLGRVALLESMLMFFFSICLWFFFLWLRTPKNWLLFLSGIAVGLGFLTKYQIIIVIGVMFLDIVVLCGGYIKERLIKLPVLLLLAIVIVLPWILVCYEVYASGMLSQWLYAVSVGNPDKLVYSQRFLMPIFYLVEMVWPYGVVHPISIFSYIIGLTGMGLLLWRRKAEDKFLLIWFVIVYSFFTLIGNKQWRYVFPLFPVLAIASANVILCLYDKIEKSWKINQKNLNRKNLGKIGAGFLLAIVAFSIAFSCADAYAWVSKDAEFNLPINATVNYILPQMNSNDTLLILCPLNIFSSDIIRFYINAAGSGEYRILQYPDYPLDTFTPDFDATELIIICGQFNVKYLLLFEYGEIYPYYNSTLTMLQVKGEIIDSQRFTYEISCGSYPCRIFIFSFA